MALLGNITLWSLALSGLTNPSAFFSLTPTSARNSHSIRNSQFARAFGHAIFSPTRLTHLSLTKSRFQHFTSSAISIAAEKTHPLKLIEFQHTLTSAELNGTCEIKWCTFIDLTSSTGGGGISIGPESSLDLTVTLSGFRKCQSTEPGGAINFHGQSLKLSEVCFDRCVTFKRGQALAVFDCDFLFNTGSVHKCSMPRPCGESGAIFGSSASMKLFTMNASTNTVVEHGAVVYAEKCSTMWIHYAMISHNVGESLFKFAGDVLATKSGLIEHCSIMYNQLEGEGTIVSMDEHRLQMGENNFIDNNFKKLCTGGTLEFVSRVIVDFNFKDSLVDRCRVEGRERVMKVSFMDANMASMSTWGCWAMGAREPTPSRSVPHVNARDIKGDTGFVVFLEVAVAGSLVAGMFYFFVGTKMKPKDLNELQDVEISNK